MHLPRATVWSIGLVSLSVWAAGFAMTGDLLSGTPATLLLISPQATETITEENGKTVIDVSVPANTGLAFIFNAEAFWLGSGESTSCLLETTGPVRNIKVDSTTATSNQVIRRPRGTLYVDIKDATVTVSIACKRDAFDMFGTVTGKEMTRPYTYRINKGAALAPLRSSSSSSKSSSSRSSSSSWKSSSSRVSSSKSSSSRPQSSSAQTISIRSDHAESSSSSSEDWNWPSSESSSSSSDIWHWSSSEEHSSSSSSSESWNWPSSESSSSSSDIWHWSSSEEHSSSSSESWHWSSSEEQSWSSSESSEAPAHASSHRSQTTIAIPQQQALRPQGPGCFAQDGTWITDRLLCAKEQNDIIERMRAQRQAEAQAGVIREEVPAEALQVLETVPVRELRAEEEAAVRARMQEKFLEDERLRKRKAEIVATMREAAKRITAAASASPSPDAQAYLTQAGTWYESAAAFAQQEGVTWESLSELTEAGKKVGNDAQQVVTLFRPAAPKPPTGLLERIDRILDVFPEAVALAAARGATPDVTVWKYHEEAVFALKEVWPRCEADPKACPELERVLAPLEQASALLKQAVERSGNTAVKEEIEGLLQQRP